MAGESLASVADLLERELPKFGAFELEGRLTGPLDELALTDLSGRIGDATGLVIEVTDGRIADVLDGRGIQPSVQAAGPSVAALGDLVGRDLPELGAYEGEGELAGSIEDLALVDLTGTICAESVAAIRITDGQIGDVLAGGGIRVQLAAAGAELARLPEALAIEMAPFGPFRFRRNACGQFRSPALRDLSATAGDEATRIELAGAIENVLALSGLDLSVSIEGQNLAALSPLARVDLPASEPYRITGDVSGSAANLRIEELAVEVADSTFGGWLAVHRSEPRTPCIEGELNADRLDVDRILALADRAADDEWRRRNRPRSNRHPVKVGCFPPRRSRSKRWTDPARPRARGRSDARCDRIYRRKSQSRAAGWTAKRARPRVAGGRRSSCRRRRDRGGGRGG